MRLNIAAALESPCATCGPTPCCKNLPLQKFAVSTLVDLDHARYLLNFDRIVLGIVPGGEWSVFLATPCQFLDTASGQCMVHGTSRQPHICSTYNPYTCWYKRGFASDVNEDLMQVDLRRWQCVADRTFFDTDRHVIEAPSWDDLALAFAELPIDASPKVAQDSPVTIGPRTRAASSECSPLTQSPCDGCAAPCCTTLVFPSAIPEHASHLDFLRFALGFPGVRVATGLDEWALAVSTSCRHLDGARCSVYGKAERPLRCAYYDEWRCNYKSRFGERPPRDTVLLDLEAFVALLPQFGFDEEGRINRGPTPDELLAHVGRQ